jgi:hypothetical protein
MEIFTKKDKEKYMHREKTGARDGRAAEPIFGTRRGGAVRAAALALCLVLLAARGGDFASAGSEGAAPRYEPGRLRAPVSAFAEEFMAECEGGQWLLDETERLLNARQQSIDWLSPDMLLPITSLGMKDCGAVGTLPKAIGRFKNLEYLFLSGNSLSGPLPEELFTLKNLKNIDLSDNLYEGEIPAGFALLPKLEVLRLSGCRWSGALPKWLGGMTGLRTLDLSANRLKGGLIPQLAGMARLQYLDLSDNPLGGPIPEAMCGMKELETLLMWDDGLTGELPEGVSGMESLKYLDLAGNELTGPLPEGLGELRGLTVLNLSHNLLRGVIPNVFEGTPLLERVHLDGNRLRGRVPDSLAALHASGASVTFPQNYLTGLNVLAIEKDCGAAASAGNFADGSDHMQYRLAGPSYMRLAVGQPTDVYPLLRNVRAKGSTALPKPMLPALDYEALVTPAAFAEVLKAEVEADGIRLAALAALPRASGAAVEIRIKDNAGSEWSAWTLRAGTDAPPSGGGGSGGGMTAADEETPAAPAPCLPYIRGYEDGTARPDGNLTREEAATMLCRISGETEPPPPTRAPFADVAAGRWSAGHIASVKEKKLMRGDGDGTFRPSDPMTRDEFAALLCRMTGAPLEDTEEATGGCPLTDLGGWAAPYVRAAWKAGYVKGYEDMTFCGAGKITRAEAACMINGALGRKPVKDKWDGAAGLYPDLSPRHWGWFEVMEASVAHVH